MTTGDAVLEVNDVVVRRGGRRILDSVSFSVNSGSRMLIRGESGAGKTTLFQLLGLLATPDSGSVLVNGFEASNLSEANRAQIRRNEVGLVFQDFQLIPDLTAWENAALPQQHGGNEIDRDWLEYLFKSLGIANQSDQYPNSLSGGEKQRVAIIRALANHPSVIVADEPTGQLDPETSNQVLSLLHDMHTESDACLVVISHDVSIGDEFGTVRNLVDGRFT